MKKIFVILSILFIGFWGCKKKNKELPAPEAAVIEITPLDGNTFIVRNATPTGGAGNLWDFGDLGTSTQYSDTLFYAYAGTYPITLTSNSKGGISKTQTTVTVNKTSIYAADYTVEKQDAFHFKLTVTTPNAVKQLYRYSSYGVNDTNKVATAYLPFAGDHTISLTVWVNKDGSIVPSTLKKTVHVDSDDMSNPDLSDKFYKLMTGGLDDTDGRTWKIDPTPGLSGIGPYNRKRIDLDYWDYTKFGGYLGNPAWTEGALLNEFTFIMRNYQFKPLNHKATANWFIGNEKLGMTNAKEVDKAFEDPNIRSAAFVLKNEKSGPLGYMMRFNLDTYIGFYQNRYFYEITKVSATDDSVWVRQTYNDNGKDYTAAQRDNPAEDPNCRTLLLVLKK